MPNSVLYPCREHKSKLKPIRALTTDASNFEQRAAKALATNIRSSTRCNSLKLPLLVAGGGSALVELDSGGPKRARSSICSSIILQLLPDSGPIDFESTTAEMSTAATPQHGPPPSVHHCRTQPGDKEMCHLR